MPVFQLTTEDPACTHACMHACGLFTVPFCPTQHKVSYPNTVALIAKKHGTATMAPTDRPTD